MCIGLRTRIYNRHANCCGEIYRWKAEEMCKRARNHFPFMQIWWSRLLAPREDVAICNKYTASQKISIELFPLLWISVSFFFGKRVLPVLLLLQKSSGAWNYYITRKRRRRRRYRFIPISIFGACRLHPTGNILEMLGGPGESWICIMYRWASFIDRWRGHRSE